MAREKGYWQKRTTRRWVLRSAATAGAAVSALAVLGCGNQEKPASTDQTIATTAKSGGTFNHPALQVDAYWTGFDAHTSGGRSFTGIQGLFYQNLIRPNVRTWEPEPELAQKWEQPSLTEYTFTLSPGVKWHNKPPVNGRDLTAQDVEFSLERIRTDDPKFLSRSFLASVDKIQAVDKATVKLTMKSPDVTTLANLSDLTMRMLAPEAIERWGTGKLTGAETAIGTGAFILQDLDDVSATLVRNPEYWKPGLPYLDRFRLLRIREPEAQWAAFLTGQLDMAHVPGIEAKKFLNEQRQKYFLDWFLDIGVQQIYVNTRKEPFNDQRVSRALRLLVDHREFITGWAETWFGGAALQGGSHFPRALESWEYSEAEYQQASGPLFLEWKSPKDDAAKVALDLLSAAGFNRSNPLKFELAGITTVWSKPATELLHSQYQRLGQGVVQPEIKIYENPALITLQAQGNYEVAGPIGRASFTDPDQVFSQVYRTNGAWNLGKYTDSRLDQMIDRQRTMFQIAERKAAVKDILKYLIENAPYTGSCSRDQLNAAQLKVKNFAPISVVTAGHHYEEVWLDT